jgi:hypothetical protein
LAQENAGCPQIKVVSPDGKYVSGQDMPFSISLSEEAKNLKLEYAWEISNGGISQGQGTPAITIDTAGLSGTPVIVKVEIKGLPAKCANTFSGRSYVEEIPRHPPPLNDCEIPESPKPLNERLNELALELSKNKDSKAFVEIFFKNISERRKTNKIFTHLTKNHRIADERIKFGIHKKTYCSKVNVFIVPKGAKLPECENCEIIKGEDLRIKKSSQRK